MPTGTTIVVLLFLVLLCIVWYLAHTPHAPDLHVSHVPTAAPWENLPPQENLDQPRHSHRTRTAAAAVVDLFAERRGPHPQSQPQRPTRASMHACLPGQTLTFQGQWPTPPVLAGEMRSWPKISTLWHFGRYRD
ncbi:uncharacterized protein B0I36DRAFT_137047 [Microdochium trichocladiopsis]|uniref:Uncharacterized protein n=1 Tax=Microdochium trichocladiopsis TaxID=1682393 RepID=A0A9P8Y013_9PEZI|nr:uncharacterized protein B0I36DRAFT_137047 [Microdochium trichocladiopsis]KAH7027283.1 hypothetical protein B0I36DRAFT_137047 [Microdochium trichocladiopsis]